MTDTVARVWVTTPDGESRVRWSARLIITDGEAHIVDGKGNAEVYPIAESGGRWLATADGYEVTWIPSTQRARGAQAAYIPTATEKATEETADVVDFPALDDEDSTDWEQFTVAELRRFAAAAGHTGISRYSKADLIDLLGG